MAWTEFYLQTTGDDLNAGSTTADTSAYTSTAGNFDGTSVFTPTDGQTTSSFVAVNDYVALYNTGDTVCRCVAKVTAVGAGVNGTITVSTTIKYGTVPTSNSGSRACKAGGAWASLAITQTSAPLNTGTAPQSTRINVKAGTYANTTTTRNLGLSGSATVGVWWRGYKTAIGDQDTNNVAVAGTDIPLLTWTTARLVNNAGHTHMSNFALTTAMNPSGSALNNSGNINTYHRVRCNNTSTASGAGCIGGSGTQGIYVACSFVSTSTTATTIVVGLGGNNTGFFGCYFSRGTKGLDNGAINGTLLVDCIFDAIAGDAVIIPTGGNAMLINCSFYAPTGNGINITGLSSSFGILVQNCYFENVNQASKAAINNTSGTNDDQIRCIGNAYFNCTANRAGLTEDFTIFDNGTLASAGFVNPGSQNFAMAAVGQGIGFPGLFENTSAYQGYLDVGAVQHQAGVGTLRPFPGSGGII